MSKGYIRKETVLAFLRVCRVRMNDLMTVRTMESNHEAAQAAYTCRCYLDEEIQQVKKHPAAAVVKIKREGKTRADRVRAMTDEELAEFLKKVGGCGPSFDVKYCNNVNGCPEGINCWPDWLRQEVEADAKLD